MNLKWTSENSLKLSRIITAAVFALGVIVLFLIPIITQWYDDVSCKPPIMPILTAALYLGDAVFLLAMWQLIKLLRNIAKQELFTAENVRCVRIISWCCFGAAAVMLALSFWRLTAFMVAFMAGFVGLILRVVKNMLASAAEMREESDYTI